MIVVKLIMNILSNLPSTSRIMDGLKKTLHSAPKQRSPVAANKQPRLIRVEPTVKRKYRTSIAMKASMTTNGASKILAY